MVTLTKEQHRRFAVAAFEDLAYALDDKYKGIGPEGYCAEQPEMTPVESALRHAARCLADFLAHDQGAK